LETSAITKPITLNRVYPTGTFRDIDVISVSSTVSA